jgi:phosphonopyruvate decarboxylase
MIDAREFLDALKQRNVGLFVCVPCSLLKPFINHVIVDDALRYVSAVSEGEAVGIAVGSTLTGKTGVVMLQNSGLGNIVNPVTSLTNIYRIPCLIIVSQRGEPGMTDAIQHSIMGRITGELLDLLDIHRQHFPKTADAVGPAVGRAFDHMRGSGLPSAFVVKRGMVEAFDPEFPLRKLDRQQTELCTLGEPPDITLSRKEAIKQIIDLSDARDLVVSATGMISRELFAYGDRPANFYMQGSMGTAAAIGLGVALNRPDRRMIVLDGDGAVLMRMGSLATVGYCQPRQFLHVVLDNESHDTTGGQPTASPAVDFPGVALASGYRRAATVYGLETLRGCWARFYSLEGPSLLHIKVLKGGDKRIGRPTRTPEGIRDRFMGSVNG